MNKKDDILQDKILTRQLNLLRFTAGEQKKVIAILNQLQKDLKNKLLTDLTDFSKARVNKLLKETNELISSYYKEIKKEVDFESIAKSEAEATRKSFFAIELEAALPTITVLKQLVRDSLIEGAPSAKWWGKQSSDLAFKFAAQVRQGVAGNETIQQIVQRIIGSKRLGVAGIMETTKAGARALVHTSVMQVASDAKMATFQANEDVIKGVRQLSTFDSHTTLICAAYSGASYKLDGTPINGTTLPMGSIPRHFNCRSTWIPITKTYKELGIDIPEKSPGTRASDEGQVKSDITMKEWLKNKPPQYVDNLLGKGKAELFLSGKITLPQLLDFTGNELSLKELVEKYAG